MKKKLVVIFCLLAVNLFVSANLSATPVTDQNKKDRDRTSLVSWFDKQAAILNAPKFIYKVGFNSNYGITAGLVVSCLSECNIFSVAYNPKSQSTTAYLTFVFNSVSTNSFYIQNGISGEYSMSPGAGCSFMGFDYSVNAGLIYDTKNQAINLGLETDLLLR
jgi:hypothetical protein